MTRVETEANSKLEEVIERRICVHECYDCLCYRMLRLPLVWLCGMVVGWLRHTLIGALVKRLNASIGPDSEPIHTSFSTKSMHLDEAMSSADWRDTIGDMHMCREYVDSLQTGYGLMTWADGRRYEGYCVNSK